MKKIAKTAIGFIFLLLLLVVAPVNKTKAQFRAGISIQAFYGELAPYGQWVDDPEWGYVWIPDAGVGFRPYYSGGHWVMTRYGATWVSDYPWGWAPFHYGRWTYSSYYGWVWIPGTDWGPAWVSWRWGGGYYGWAPLGPGISINFSFGSGYYAPNEWWVFVPAQYYLSPSFYSYAIAPAQNITYIRNTTVVSNTYVDNGVTYVSGPRINQVEKATGKKVKVYDVASVSRPGKTSLQGNAVRTYRPQVTKASKENAKPPSVMTRDQFTKNKGQRTTDVQKNNRPESNKQVNQPAPKTQQKNVRETPAQRREVTQPAEKKQIPQQKNNRQVTPERNKQVSQPVPKTEQKNIRQAPVRRQETNQRVQPTERKQIQQPNRQVVPERSKQISQPVPQQRNIRQAPVPQQPGNQPAQQPSKPTGKAKGKGK